MPVLRHIGCLATCRAEGGQAEIHAGRDAALVWCGDTIAWVGPDAKLPDEFRELPPAADGVSLVIPGLIDCHTHLAFGGWRAEEFEQRIRGRSEAEILAAGGGIMNTVVRTRAASDSELLARCRAWLGEIAALGVTTIEAKSGYGLSVSEELRLLEIYRGLGESQPVRIVATLLAAHIVPAEYANDRAAYLRLVVSGLIPEVAQRRLARFCDVFVDEHAFTRDEARAILSAAREHGLAPKLHADQFTDGGGATLAELIGAVSADHLDCVSEQGIERLTASGTVAVSLPLASLYLSRAPMPARRLIEAGVPVAVATDFNPGTAPSFHLPLAMLLACTLQRMTPAESLKGATLYAARAIGEEACAGSLEPGKRADFALIDAPGVNQWLYNFCANCCAATYIGGQRVPR
ncbi:MAG: imidazolonepropionase [Terriglobia bacterium]